MAIQSLLEVCLLFFSIVCIFAWTQPQHKMYSLLACSFGEWFKNGTRPNPFKGLDSVYPTYQHQLISASTPFQLSYFEECIFCLFCQKWCWKAFVLWAMIWNGQTCQLWFLSDLLFLLSVCIKGIKKWHENMYMLLCVLILKSSVFANRFFFFASWFISIQYRHQCLFLGTFSWNV